MPFNADTSTLSSFTCADAEAWSYYLSKADSGEYLVWRDNPSGDAELLLRVTQPENANGLENAIQYEGGAAESGGKYLYFTISDYATFHRSLWVLNTETLFFAQMFDAPCSNLVIPSDSVVLSDPPSDFFNIGWVVYDHYLVPIELEKAEEYTGGIIDLNDYYAPLGEELFYGVGANGTHKFVQLSDVGGTLVEIQSITAEPETSAEETSTAHIIDFSNGDFS